MKIGCSNNNNRLDLLIQQPRSSENNLDIEMSSNNKKYNYSKRRTIKYQKIEKQLKILT